MEDREHEELALACLKSLVEIDSTPSGQTDLCVYDAGEHLRQAGFFFGSVARYAAPFFTDTVPSIGRKCLIAGIPGTDPNLKPVLLMAHLDTVAAPKQGWNTDPLKLVEKDGYLFGRGVLDDKGSCAQLIAMIARMKRDGFRPKRGVRIALTGDEEQGSYNGVKHLLDRYKDFMDVEYALNLDMTGGHLVGGKRRRLCVQVEEKANASFRITATGKGGHSSLVDYWAKNPIMELTNALQRLRTKSVSCNVFPFHADDIAGECLELPSNERSPYAVAIMRTTLEITQIEGGHAFNATPQAASAVVNARIHPEESVDLVEQRISAAVATDDVKVERIFAANPVPRTPMRDDVWEAVNEVACNLFPGVPVVRTRDPWATDARLTRRAGIPTFGVGGTFFDPSDCGAHGVNEKISKQSFLEGTHFIHQLVRTLTA